MIQAASDDVAFCLEHHLAFDRTSKVRQQRNLQRRRCPETTMLRRSASMAHILIHTTKTQSHFRRIAAKKKLYSRQLMTSKIRCASLLNQRILTYVRIRTLTNMHACMHRYIRTYIHPSNTSKVSAFRRTWVHLLFHNMLYPYIFLSYISQSFKCRDFVASGEYEAKG